MWLPWTLSQMSCTSRVTSTGDHTSWDVSVRLWRVPINIEVSCGSRQSEDKAIQLLCENDLTPCI